ncbi:hypothetical protein BGX38DRAFT_1165842 [Terfezia claveryi]|nr:hypothetical protein BGX38DRAFT_1165842 [Terfezia claveryi]
MDLVRYVRRISFVYLLPSRFPFIMGGEITSLNSLSRLLFALLCFTLLSDFVYFFSFTGPGWRCRRVQGQYMVGAKHRPRLQSHPSYPHYQDHHPLPSSDIRWDIGVAKQRESKATTFLLSFSSFLGGVICLFTSIFFLTKLRDPRRYDLTG